MLNLHLNRLRNNVGALLIKHRFGVALYSRRSNSNHSSVDEFINNTNVGINPNWELLNTHGYRFFLPGSVGLAWTEPSSTINANSQVSRLRNVVAIILQDVVFLGIDCLELDCTVQECPLLLRQGVVDMFPGASFGECELSVVTLSQKKTKIKKSQPLSFQELEKLTKMFVITASEICVKLKVAGYWADFINPFSGLPYLNPFYNSQQEVDKQLSAGFRIVEKNNCRVIANSGSKNIVGSVYTTAPSASNLLLDILKDFEE